MKKSLYLILFINIFAFSQNQAIIVNCNIDQPKFVLKNLKPNAVSIKTFRKTPAVINVNSSNFLLEVIVFGIPSSIEFEFDGASSRTKMFDNGTVPDKVANDGIYSVLINKPSAGWNHAKVLGYVYLFENGNQQAKYNFFTEVRTAEMPTPTIKKINEKIQYSDYIFNITDDIGSKNFANEVPIALEFYKYHRDDFDFLNYILIPGYADNRFHSTVRNSVQGIGENIFNAGATYGSASRLKGFNYAPQLSIFDGINNGFNHETGHQWINWAKNSFLKDGVPHMPAANIANGVMGISIGGAGGAGGNFNNNLVEEGNSYRLTTSSTASQGTFNDWELYLMGIIPATEVKSQAIVFKDQSKFPTGGLYPKTDFNIYTINDFISQVGSRVPDASQSQKQFTMATIVVSEKLLSEDEMAYLNFNLKRAESNVALEIRDGLTTALAKPFRLATGDRATMRTLLNTNANCASLPLKPTISSINNFKFCEGSQAELSVTLNAGEQAIWYHRGVPLEERTNKILAKELTGAYTVSIRNNAGCNSLESNEVKLTKNSNPFVPIIQSSNGTEIDFGKNTVLSTNISSVITHQWLKDNVAIPNATTNIFTVSESGTYTLKVTNSEGCSTISEPVKITIKPQVLALSHEEINQKIRLYPNPADDNLTFEFYATKEINANLSILNIAGKLIRPNINVNLKNAWNSIKVDIQTLASGTYFIQFEYDGQIYTKKFTKLR